MGLKTLLRKCNYLVLTCGFVFSRRGSIFGISITGSDIFLWWMTGEKYVHFRSFCEGQSFVFVKKVHLFWRGDLRCHVWWRFELVVELEGEWMFTVVSTDQIRADPTR